MFLQALNRPLNHRTHLMNNQQCTPYLPCFFCSDARTSNFSIFYIFMVCAGFLFSQHSPCSDCLVEKHICTTSLPCCFVLVPLCGTFLSSISQWFYQYFIVLTVFHFRFIMSYDEKSTLYRPFHILLSGYTSRTQKASGENLIKKSIIELF